MVKNIKVSVNCQMRFCIEDSFHCFMKYEIRVVVGTGGLGMFRVTWISKGTDEHQTGPSLARQAHPHLLPLPPAC